MEVVNAIGRRKAAVARVFVSEGTGKITINKRDVERKKPGRPKARKRFQFSKR